MRQLLNAIIFQENGWQVAQCVEIDVASQGNTDDEALANLQEALTLHFRAPCNHGLPAFAQSISEAAMRIPGAVHKTLEIENG
ncbi:MAG: type II toxin-antitoxin system HicB family antitoxin [Candidatus Obscuribacterales bacterium]|nr:type II toxin-antitoxin system HicB family antitoxin [Candidatus Obscuribacterales bacterium]